MCYPLRMTKHHVTKAARWFLLVGRVWLAVLGLAVGIDETLGAHFDHVGVGLLTLSLAALLIGAALEAHGR